MKKKAMKTGVYSSLFCCKIYRCLQYLIIGVSLIMCSKNVDGVLIWLSYPKMNEMSEQIHTVWVNNKHINLPIS